MTTSQDENISILSSITNKFFASSPTPASKKHSTVDNRTGKSSDTKPTNKRPKKSRNNPYDHAKRPNTRSMTKKAKLLNKIENNDTEMETEYNSDTASAYSDALTSDNENLSKFNINITPKKMRYTIITQKYHNNQKMNRPQI